MKGFDCNVTKGDTFRTIVVELGRFYRKRIPESYLSLLTDDAIMAAAEGALFTDSTQFTTAFFANSLVISQVGTKQAMAVVIDRQQNSELALAGTFGEVISETELVGIETSEHGDINVFCETKTHHKRPDLPLEHSLLLENATTFISRMVLLKPVAVSILFKLLKGDESTVVLGQLTERAIILRATRDDQEVLVVFYKEFIEDEVNLGDVSTRYPFLLQ